MGAAAGVGGSVEVEGRYGGLRGVDGARLGWVVAEGARPPQAIETCVETRMLSCLVLSYY